MTKWIIYAEESSPYRRVIEYVPVPNSYGIRIRAVKDAIRIASGARWAVDGYYLQQVDQLDVRYDTLSEAKRAAEKMMGGAR